MIPPTPCFSEPEAARGGPRSPVGAACPRVVPSQADSWRPGPKLGGKGFSLLRERPSHSDPLHAMPGSGQWGGGQGLPGRAPRWVKGRPAGLGALRAPGHPRWAEPRPPGGGRPGCAPRAGHQASPPLLAAPRPRPRREPERPPQPSGADGRPGRTDPLLGGGGGGRKRRERGPDPAASASPRGPPRARRGQRAPGGRRAGAREMRSRGGGASGATGPAPPR